MIKTTIIVHKLFLTLFLIQSLNAQIEVKSINSVPLAERGVINNPVWSRDSRTVAFEFLGIGNKKKSEKKSKVMIYRLGSDQSAKPLLKGKESISTFDQTTDEISSRLPFWSSTTNNTLYFLYEKHQHETRYIGKYDLEYIDLPVNTDEVTRLWEYIMQPSGISEYYPISVDGREYLFIRLKDSPGLVFYTNQSDKIGYETQGRLKPDENKVIIDLKKWIKSNEPIDSFSLFKNAFKIIICKGDDKDKTFLLGELDIEETEADYHIVPVPKSEDGVLQEPSFNPTNSDVIAYLEVIGNKESGMFYHLLLQRLDTPENYLLSNDLYRNEDGKSSKPNSTSYVWHPNGNYIFFISTDEKRKVAYVDLSNLQKPKIRKLETDIEFAEQLAISPDGKYLAVMTKIASETDDTDALGQLFIVELTL